MGDAVATRMNATEKGRIDAAEQAIVGLSGRMDSFDSRLTKVEQTGAETNEIAHKLLARQGGYEATRGMVPVSNLWAAAALFATLLGIGITMLTLYNNTIHKEIVEDRETIQRVERESESEIARLDVALQREMRDLDSVGLTRLNSLDKYLQLEFKSADDLAESKREALKIDFDQRFTRLENDIHENTSTFTDFRDTYFIPLEERVRAIENSRATSGMFTALVDRVSTLEVQAARNDERVTKTWDEIGDHEDELDHPIRQTFEGESRSKEIEYNRQQILRLEELIRGNSKTEHEHQTNLKEDNS